jgi:hypothetical protein
MTGPTDSKRTHHDGGWGRLVVHVVVQIVQIAFRSRHNDET